MWLWIWILGGPAALAIAYTPVIVFAAIPDRWPRVGGVLLAILVICSIVVDIHMIRSFVHSL